MASFCLQSSVQRPTSKPAPFSRSGSVKTRQRFAKAIIGWTYSRPILGPARALGVDKVVIMGARSNLDDLCNQQMAMGDGCLGPMNALALAQAAGVAGLVPADTFMAAALRYRLVRRTSHGVLWNTDFTERNTNSMQHDAARQVREADAASRRRDQNAERMRAWRAQQKADAFEMRQAEHWPSSTPHMCAFAHTLPTKSAQNAHAPRPDAPKLALVPKLPSGDDRLGADKKRTECAHNAQNGSNRPIEALYGDPPDLYSTGQRSDAGLGELLQSPTAPLAANEPLTLKPGKNLPLGGPSTTLSANTVVATEKRAPSAQSVPIQAHTRQNRRMEPPDDLDEGYFTSLEQSDGPNHGLLGGMAKAQRPQPIVEHPSSQPPSPPQPPVAALNEQQARPRATAASGRPPRAPWQTAMPAGAASTHRVVSASTPPSQVRHTTPSPAMNDAENDAAAAESLKAAEAVKNPPPLSAERESEIDVGRRAIAEILAKLR